MEYPTAPGFIAALAERIAPLLNEAAAQHVKVRLLLSAHGLPLKIVHAGDPYPQQVVATAAALAAVLDRPGLDWVVCYQSRVGPLAWLGPATDDEIRRAGGEGIPLVVAPISFVSEHSETLVELDRDYCRLAESSGVPAYYRAPTVGTHPRFITALAELVRAAA
jgi:ferrochelatase